MDAKQKKNIILGGIAVVALGGAAYLLFLRGDAPPPKLPTQVDTQANQLTEQLKKAQQEQYKRQPPPPPEPEVEAGSGRKKQAVGG